MFQNIVASLRMIVVMVVVCAVCYPLALLSFAMISSPDQRMGSLVRDQSGQPIGSRLLAQAFTQAGYFWPRPSAVDYNAAGAGGSNLSPHNPQVRQRAEEILRRMELTSHAKTPAELVTTSGAGLDPHITFDGALVQVPRVALARSISGETVKQLIARVAETYPAGPPGGDPLVNVLMLNLELNREYPSTTPVVTETAATP